MREGAFAAVGTDGVRPVVWGIGADEDSARTEALSELRAYHAGAGGGDAEVDAEDLTVHPITDAQALVILAGDVSWPVQS